MEREAEAQGQNISQSDIDRIKKDIAAMKKERSPDRDTIEELTREANGLRHRLLVVKKSAAAGSGGRGGGGIHIR